MARMQRRNVGLPLSMAEVRVGERKKPTGNMAGLKREMATGEQLRPVKPFRYS